MNYVHTGCMMQVHRGRWVGTSLLFIGGRKPTYVCFLLESTRKGHLIPGAVIFSIPSCFHWKTLFLGQSTRRSYIVFHWLLFPGQIRLCAIYVCKQFMKQFLGWRYVRFLFHINFISYHWLQFISVQTDSFRVRSDSIRMYMQFFFILFFEGKLENTIWMKNLTIK